MHGRTKTDEQGTVESLEMPVPSTSGGRTRRTGLLTVMERPPGNIQILSLNVEFSLSFHVIFKKVATNCFFRRTNIILHAFSIN